MSARLGSYSLESLFTFGNQRQERRRQLFAEQARLLVEELGRLKGSVMKVGQLLALYGEQLNLPEEVVEALRTLQDDSSPLAWPALESMLRAELDEERLIELEVDPEPLAAASLGQVHRARRRVDGRELCIKIQYPGVAEAVDSDLDMVGMLLLFSRMLPTGFNPLAFRLLPQQTRLKIGIPALARLMTQHSDVAGRVVERGHYFEYTVERCADCWGRSSKRPVCNLTVGLLLEAMSSFGRGQEFRVTQTECHAAGAARCVFQLDKEPIA